jgi:hypothetical protein
MIGRQLTVASLVIATGCMFLAACSGSPSAPTATAAAGPSPSQAMDRSGNYTGTAQPVNTAGGLCTRPLPMTGSVIGNSAQFGDFRGTIDPAGGAKLFSGDQWITGQFQGATFQGQLTIPPRPSRPAACSYALTMDRIGS